MGSAHEKLEKMKRRIYQMLAKAESTTPEEAAALEEAAETLMVKYGISKAMLDDADETKPNIIEIRMEFDTQWQTAWLDGFSDVVYVMQCTPLVISRKGQCVLYIVGFKDDAQMAERLIASLRIQSVPSMSVWWRASYESYGRFLTNHQRHVVKKNFMRGFGVGAASRILDKREEAMMAAGPGTEVVLASRKELVEQHVVEKIGVKDARMRHYDDDRAAYAGYVAGYAAADSSTDRSVEKSRPALR